MTIVPFVGVLFQLNELTCYIIIYSEILTHNKDMLGKTVISKDIYLKRKQHNTFTLAGQLSWYIMLKSFLYKFLRQL
jgi:hypothetical protein